MSGTYRHRRAGLGRRTPGCVWSIQGTDTVPYNRQRALRRYTGYGRPPRVGWPDADPDEA